MHTLFVAELPNLTW